MKKPYDLAICIGRFQPFHIGHEELIEHAFEKADQVLILVGSSNVALSYKNPWTYNERREMISSVLHKKYGWNFSVAPLPDQTKDKKWQTIIKTEASRICDIDDSRICVVGHEKDHSSYYLKDVPFDKIFVNIRSVIHATEIREFYFNNARLPNLVWDKILSDEVAELLAKWTLTNAFTTTLAEFNYYDNYSKTWKQWVKKPFFVTADLLMSDRQNNILLIERGGHPGKGLLAIPGGFVNHDETTLNAACREFTEETSLTLKPIEKINITQPYSCNIFDNPGRSQRGRIISHVFTVQSQLDLNTRILGAKAGDDASNMFVIPLKDIKRENMFEDHYDIIQQFMKWN